jgi:uncharacterized protein (DUF427 family)
MPERVLYLEPLRRRMNVELGGSIIARSDEAVILFGSPPATPLPTSRSATSAKACCSRPTTRAHTQTSARRKWFNVVGGDGETTQRGAWEHVDPPAQATALRDTVAFAWHAMDAF